MYADVTSAIPDANSDVVMHDIGRSYLLFLLLNCLMSKSPVVSKLPSFSDVAPIMSGETISPNVTYPDVRVMH